MLKKIILLAGFCLLLTPAGAQNRDALWNIVSECLEPGAPDYCARCSQPLVGQCGRENQCDKGGATRLLAKTQDYVAMNDRKMCGCGADFVHTLTMPLSRVTGIEDPNRPEEIWAFAWAEAKKSIAEEDSIVLAINPPHRRSQDQMHIHSMRLLAEGRERFMGQMPEEIADLEHVWDAGRRHAERAGLKGWYGLVVVRSTAGSGFLVVTVAGNADRAFAQAACR